MWCADGLSGRIPSGCLNSFGEADNSQWDAEKHGIAVRLGLAAHGARIGKRTFCTGFAGEEKSKGFRIEKGNPIWRTRSIM